MQLHALSYDIRLNVKKNNKKWKFISSCFSVVHVELICLCSYISSYIGCIPTSYIGFISSDCVIMIVSLFHLFPPHLL